MSWFRPRRWIMNMLIALDQFGNAIIGGAPDETISARAGRYKNTSRWWGGLAKVLNWIDPGHTNHAVEAEKERRHLPPDYTK